jgi:hypothetical protein
MMPLGLIVPIIADWKVYLGRSFITSDFENKTVMVDQFYSGSMTGEQARQFVMRNNIGYVILLHLKLINMVIIKPVLWKLIRF